jgi:actin-related protein
MIIIDVGSGKIRVGINNLKLPSRQYLTYQHMMSRGVVINWDKFYKQLQSILIDDFNIQNTGLLIAESIVNSEQSRQKLLDYCIKYFSDNVTIIKQPLLIALNYDIKTGIVVDIGKQSTTITLVVENQLLPQHFYIYPITGDIITNYLRKILINNGYNFLNKYPDCAIDDIKHSHCFIAKNYKRLNKMSTRRYKYNFNGQNQIHLRKATFQAPEPLFDPLILGYDINPLPQLIIKLIQQAPIDYRKIIYQNIILAGGCSKMRGFSKRLEKELKKLNSEINIFNYHDPEYVAWSGGANYASKCLNKKD